MKAMRWALLLMVPMLAQASDVRQDYRQQWPLQMTGSDAGLYQVTLNAAVYRAAHDAALRDVTVIDAHGQELPTAWLPMDAAPAGGGG
ncbi:DUF3999 family protein, partial [Xanthomonas citri]|uniref:DUF3999 family protein n=2 Tax=Xanthomonas citri TaxID=346 RepID=UPI00058F382B